MRYPTNSKDYSRHPPGTRFKLANGHIVRRCDSATYDDHFECEFVNPSPSSFGNWHLDGTKMYPEDWPAGCDIVAVLGMP